MKKILMFTSIVLLIGLRLPSISYASDNHMIENKVYEIVSDMKDISMDPVVKDFTNYLDSNPQKLQAFLDGDEDPIIAINKLKSEFFKQSELCQNKFKSEDILKTPNIVHSNQANRTINHFSENNNRIDIKNSITKYGVRLDLAAVAQAAKLAGYPITGALLQHSLQDNPSNQFFGENTLMVNTIKQSHDFINAYGRFVRGGHEKISDSLTFNSPKDLAYSLHKANYSFRASTHHCYFEDYYNFEYIALKDALGLKHKAAALINNYAEYGQNIGAVNNYSIKINFEYHG